jgi:hypothetical protein
VWRIAPAPTLELGLADGAPEYLFFRAFSGAVLSDGTIVVANTGTFELRFYDAGGSHVRTVGREGDAPGEFRSLDLVGTFGGDSLLVYDLRLRRATIYGPDGTLARSYTLPEAREVAQAVGVLADGSLVLSRLVATERATGVSREPRTIDVLSADGAARATLGVFAGRESSAVIPPGGGYLGMGVPFGRGVEYMGAGDRIIVGTTDAYSLRHYDADGGLVRVIRSDQQRTLVDPAQRETMLATLSRNVRGSLAQYQQQALDAVPRYDTLPAFRSVWIDRTLNLWVQDEDGFSAETSRWQVFGSDGVFVARVELPRALEVRDIGEDYLLGTVRDELGIERVRLYRLEKTSG